MPLSSSSPGTSVEVAVEVVEAVPTDFDASDEEIEVSEKSEADISDVVSKSMASGMILG